MVTGVKARELSGWFGRHRRFSIVLVFLALYIGKIGLAGVEFITNQVKWNVRGSQNYTMILSQRDLAYPHVATQTVSVKGDQVVNGSWSVPPVSWMFDSVANCVMNLDPRYWFCDVEYDPFYGYPIQNNGN